MDHEFAEIATQAAHELLLWVGFGTLAGLTAKAIMPGRDPGGAVTTVMMGIGGSVVGCGIMAFFSSSQRVTPISPLGFVLAAAGAFLLLFFHRLFSGRFFKEGDDRNLLRRLPFRRRRQRILVQELE